MPLSEILGPQQGVDEIDHEPHGHERGERIVEDHGGPPSEPVARQHVADRQREEDEGDGKHDDVHHGMLLAAHEFAGGGMIPPGQRVLIRLKPERFHTQCCGA